MLLDSLAGAHHRRVQASLITEGWNVCGVGDWATTFRSPDGLSAARVCPFDPAYPVYVELCRRLAGNPYLPRVEVDVPLDGGGRLTVLEFLTPVRREVAAEVRRRWDERDGDLAVVRAEADTLDADSGGIPWWGGVDLNAGNVMMSLDGHVKLVDVFGLRGYDMYDTLLSDPAVVAAAFPADVRRHMLDIACIARDRSPAQIDALRSAFALA